mmetsp:Transcript_9920/g.15514  ORF Transcript_9920/g.15514 Transcript_9920/m.15514 type:complete len:376 (+) Transcript_9920:713-1840(+)
MSTHRPSMMVSRSGEIPASGFSLWNHMRSALFSSAQNAGLHPRPSLRSTSKTPESIIRLALKGSGTPCTVPADLSGPAFWDGSLPPEFSLRRAGCPDLGADVLVAGPVRGPVSGPVEGACLEDGCDDVADRATSSSYSSSESCTACWNILSSLSSSDRSCALSRGPKFASTPLIATSIRSTIALPSAPLSSGMPIATNWYLDKLTSSFNFVIPFASKQLLYCANPTESSQRATSDFVATSDLVGVPFEVGVLGAELFLVKLPCFAGFAGEASALPPKIRSLSSCGSGPGSTPDSRSPSALNINALSCTFDTPNSVAKSSSVRSDKTSPYNSCSSKRYAYCPSPRILSIAFTLSGLDWVFFLLAEGFRAGVCFFGG